jgi:hypothetical protein
MLYPEIEDYSHLEELLNDEENKRSFSLDILEAVEDDIRWSRNLDDDALARLLSMSSTATLRVLSACLLPRHRLCQSLTILCTAVS